jgi:ElaB/YqjD/DUF883 family membrane-anchored ribosome-binding protein
MNSFRRVSDLVADAEDLVGKIGDTASPEIKALRRRVESSIDDMRSDWRRYSKRRMRDARRVAEYGDDMAREHPWMLGIAGIVIGAAIIGVLASRHND